MSWFQKCHSASHASLTMILRTDQSAISVTINVHYLCPTLTAKIIIYGEKIKHWMPGHMTQILSKPMAVIQVEIKVIPKNCCKRITDIFFGLTELRLERQDADFGTFF